MNDMSLTRCRIKSAKKYPNSILLQCSTWIPVEGSGKKEFPVNVYMKNEIFSNERIKKMGLKQGLDICVTGKGYIDCGGSDIQINILLEVPRRIDFAKNSQETIIKLFDVIVTGYMQSGNFYECMCSYKNQENSQDLKYMVVKTKFQPVKGCAYNFSGKMGFLRTPKGILAPVAYAETFVKDIILDERIQTKK